LIVDQDGEQTLLAPPVPLYLLGRTPLAAVARLHQLRGLGDAKVLKSLGRSSKGRHYRG
jgi:hypothetical protein